MKISDVRVEKLLPLFMQEHPEDVALASGLNMSFRLMGERNKWNSVWGHIDDLPEDFLDALAREMDVDWYEFDADISVKRAVLKGSDKVYRTLGTKAAVLMVLNEYFDRARMEEWFEYGGRPGYFRVILKNGGSIEAPESFYILLDRVKRLSAWLEGIIVEWDMPLDIRYNASLRAGYTSINIADNGIRPDVSVMQNNRFGCALVSTRYQTIGGG